jgi:peptidoglycan/xylan/chitin deacetylase (PgdA/CDA1 family)
MSSSRREFLVAAALGGVLAACAAAKRRSAATAVSSTVTSAAVTSPTTTTTASAPGGPARFVKSGPAAGNAIAFTFHGSGDLGLLHDLLAAAKRAGAPITVFAVGNWLDANPDVAQLIASQGHELANHTYTHPALGSLGRAAIATEIVGCRDALRKHSGSGGVWFRPSGVAVPGPSILAEAGKAGYATVVGYDIDPLDYQDPGSALVISRVTSALHAGAIVSLHTGHAGTVTAFEPIVAAAKRHGLRPVTVTELLRGTA